MVVYGSYFPNFSVHFAWETWQNRQHSDLGGGHLNFGIGLGLGCAENWSSFQSRNQVSLEVRSPIWKKFLGALLSELFSLTWSKTVPCSSIPQNGAPMDIQSEPWPTNNPNFPPGWDPGAIQPLPFGDSTCPPPPGEHEESCRHITCYIHCKFFSGDSFLYMHFCSEAAI